MLKVKYYGLLSSKIDKKEDVFEATTVNELLKEIKRKYNIEVYKIAKSSLILINDQNAGKLKGYKTKLKSGDIIKILPVCAGG